MGEFFQFGRFEKVTANTLRLRRAAPEEEGPQAQIEEDSPPEETHPLFGLTDHQLNAQEADDPTFVDSHPLLPPRSLFTIDFKD